VTGCGSRLQEAAAGAVREPGRRQHVPWLDGPGIDGPQAGCIGEHLRCRQVRTPPPVACQEPSQLHGQRTVAQSHPDPVDAVLVVAAQAEPVPASLLQFVPKRSQGLGQPPAPEVQIALAEAAHLCDLVPQASEGLWRDQEAPRRLLGIQAAVLQVAGVLLDAGEQVSVMGPKALQTVVPGLLRRGFALQRPQRVATHVSPSLLPGSVVAAGQEAEPTRVPFRLGHDQELLPMGQEVQPKVLQHVLDDVLVALGGEALPQPQAAQKRRKGVPDKGEKGLRRVRREAPCNGAKQGEGGHGVWQSCGDEDSASVRTVADFAGPEHQISRDRHSPRPSPARGRRYAPPLFRPLAMPTTCVIGLLWGDEGKGKIIDLLADGVDFVVRYGGGHNAGHTLVHDGAKLVLHLVPCGIRRSGATNVIGNGVVVDPIHLREEIRSLGACGIQVRLGDNLFISERAHLILPVHVALDRVAERLRGRDKIGTTGRGIGPAYADRASRVGLRVGDLLRPEQLQEGLRNLLAAKNPLLKAFDMQTIQERPLLEQLTAIGQELAAGIVDTGQVLREACRHGKKILVEGAQGVLLDVDHGTYPFVTSSSASTGGIATGTGMVPVALDQVLGVAKAYCTRVGEGPFPTELRGDMGERLREAGKEFGSTTGRPRRCGWFDVVAARYAVDVTGATSLAITNLDVLRGFTPLMVATAYDLPNGDRTQHFPAFDLGAVKPVYEQMPGFDEDITGVREFDALPKAARDYVLAIERQAGVPITLISVGPGRDQVIRR